MIPIRKLFRELDDSLNLQADEAILLESVKRLATESIAKRAADIDRNAVFPTENIRDINRLGLNGIFIPEQFGGAGFSYKVYLACVREISAACASTGITWATNFHAILPVLQSGSEELKLRVLPKVVDGALVAIALTESGAGSDATAMKTRFERRGDEIIVTGTKQFITNGGYADHYVVFGKWSETSDPRGAISLLWIDADTPGIKVARLEDKMGHRGSATASLVFEEGRVPLSNLIGPPGDGLGKMHAFLNKSRPSVAAHALGIARAALFDTIEYANDRRQFSKRIGEFQGNQFVMADLVTDLAMCERWLWHVAERVEAGTTDLAVEASMLKLRASDLAMRLADQAVQMHGGYGYCRDLRVERLLRDAKVTQIWEGTNQIHRQAIGRALLRRD